MKKVFGICLLIALAGNTYGWEAQEERNPLNQFNWEYSDRVPAGSTTGRFQYADELDPRRQFDWDYSDRVPASSSGEFHYYEERNPMNEFK